MSPCDYGMCDTSRCREENCTDDLPQYPSAEGIAFSLKEIQEKAEEKLSDCYNFFS